MNFRRLPGLALCLTSVAGPTLAASKPQTPREAYEHYAGCTSNMLAAQAGAARESAKGAADAPKLDKMLAAMRTKAVAAGAAISIPADRVSLHIDQDRDRLVRELNQPDAAKAKQARKEIGMTTLSCAFDELGDAIAARKAPSPPTAAK